MKVVFGNGMSAGLCDGPLPVAHIEESSLKAASIEQPGDPNFLGIKEGQVLLNTNVSPGDSEVVKQDREGGNVKRC